MNDNSRRKITGIVAVSLALLSCFYLVQFELLTKVAVTFPLILELGCLLASRHRLVLDKSVVLASVIVIWTLLYHLVLMGNEHSVSLVFSLAYYIFGVCAFMNCCKNQLFRVCKYLLIFVAVLVFVDAIYRFVNPTITSFSVGANYFYRFKGKGILFTDANSIGVLVLCVLGFITYLEKVHSIERIRCLKWVYAILLVLSFCRAAIFVYCLFLFFTSSKVPSYLKSLAIVLAVVFISVNPEFIVDYLMGDVSTIAKFNVFGSIFNIDGYEPTELLLGIGYLNSISRFGIFTHSWVLTFFAESGLAGFFLMIALWFSIGHSTNWRALYVVAPVLLAGVSFFPLYCPYFYMFCSLIFAFENKAMMDS